MERLQQIFEVEVVHRYFPLHPETPDEGLTLEQLFAGRGMDIAASQDRMTRLMAEEGLEYGPRSMTYNSRLAQELAKWAESQPSGRKIHQDLFVSYFVNNINLAVVKNLIAIAEQAGLPANEARRCLTERTYRNQVDPDWARSRELGVTGVPTFVIGDQSLVGAQPLDRLESWLLAVGAERRATVD